MVIAAVGQMCSTASMTANLSQCRTLIQKASEKGAKALFLPEASDYIASSAAETVALVKHVDESEFVLGLRSEARKYSLPINVGIHEPASSGQKVKNTLLWIDAAGEITQRYQKVHLFDVEIKDGPILKESNSVEAGTSLLPPFSTPLGLKLGAMICFDLRFPAVSSRLRAQDASLLVYPSAFTIPTGRAHWSTMLRARAIENQSYVIAAAQCGPHNEAGNRKSYGHSMIVSPWGEVLAELGGWDEGLQGKEAQELGVGEPAIAIADLSVDAVEKVRREMPLAEREY